MLLYTNTPAGSDPQVMVKVGDGTAVQVDDTAGISGFSAPPLNQALAAENLTATVLTNTLDDLISFLADDPADDKALLTVSGGSRPLKQHDTCRRVCVTRNPRIQGLP